ncbi:C13 family peptidase [Polaromonas sp.]|uniref:C13 family peptidase n=1 Tax=Polaromonas sp. TaxID=1869339 RepID=UPI003267E980
MHESQAQPTLPGIPEPLMYPGERPASATFLPTGRWLVEGLRAAFFLPPREAGRVPEPWQLLVIALVVFAVDAAAQRVEVVGPAIFNLQAWLSGWWTLPVFAGLAWWAFPSHKSAGSMQPHGGVTACLVLWLVASLPNTLVYEGLMAAMVHGWVKGKVLSWPWLHWAIYAVFTAWSLGVSLFLVLRFAGWTGRAALFALVLLTCTGVTTWQFEVRTWEKDYTRSAGAESSRARLHLSQQTLEEQQALWRRTVAAIAPQRPGVTDVYGLVFAPYAAEDVFLRESTLVSRVLADRFDAAGRVVHLVNHATTTSTHPWATTLNLQRAIEALAGRMDKDNDVLVVYLTSHGARDFKLAASHWPLEVPPLSPAELREALDKAGIRHRVIAISACYSGGWIDALADDNTLVMTAADATHTSYGCGRLSELTFFGRAMFDEQLRNTHSFEQAFARAVPVIQQREIDAGKDDGFSNPQIRVGANISPVLRALEQRLQALPQPATAAGPTAPKPADEPGPGALR